MTKAFVYAGHPTVGNMVSDRLCAAGWHRVTDAGAADAVITYFTVQTALEDAYFGDNGIVQGARKGTLIVDLSCTTPTFARELNAMACVDDLVAVEAPLVVQDIFSIIQEINRQGVTILLVEQNANMALKLADYAYVLETGTITKSGTGAELLADESIKEAYLGKAKA